MIERALARNAVAAAADDRDHLALVVELCRHLRTQDRLLVSDQGGRDPRKHRRIGGPLERRLGRVVVIVEADADDLARARDRRPVLYRFRIEHLAFGGAGEVLELILAQRLAEIDRAEIDEVVALADRKAALAARGVADESHVKWLPALKSISM